MSSISSLREPKALNGRALRILPQAPFLLAKLPALVALNAPAECPLITLWLVICVLVVLFVDVLCVPFDALVKVDFVVKVLPITSRPSSNADLRLRSFFSVIDSMSSMDEWALG